MPPVRLRTSSRSASELASAIIRATGRPCSVTTIVPPFLTSRTHSLSFDFSSRIPTRRSAKTHPYHAMRLHSITCNHITDVGRQQPKPVGRHLTTFEEPQIQRHGVPRLRRIRPTIFADTWLVDTV